MKRATSIVSIRFLTSWARGFAIPNSKRVGLFQLRKIENSKRQTPPNSLSLTADSISVQQDFQFEPDDGIQHVLWCYVRRWRFSSPDRSLPAARPSRTSFSCAGRVVSWFVDDAQYSWHQSVSCSIQHRRN